MTDRLTLLDVARLPVELQRAIAETIADVHTGRACAEHGLRAHVDGCPPQFTVTPVPFVPGQARYEVRVRGPRVEKQAKQLAVLEARHVLSESLLIAHDWAAIVLRATPGDFLFEVTLSRLQNVD